MGKDMYRPHVAVLGENSGYLPHTVTRPAQQINLGICHDGIDEALEIVDARIDKNDMAITGNSVQISRASLQQSCIDGTLCRSRFMNSFNRRVQG